jgi:hypothetical protein
VENNKDYQLYVQTLDDIDAMLLAGDVERQFVQLRLDDCREAKRRSCGDPGAELSAAEIRRAAGEARKALRCNIAGSITNESLRGLSRRLAESPLLQRFCLLGDLEAVRIPAKSTLGDYRNMFPADMVRTVVETLLDAAAQPENPLALANPLDCAEVYVDCTCLLANVHFPNDWLLLRDGVHTVMQAILVIRKHGLKHRMPPPEQFRREINKLSIQMANCRRRKDSKKTRKSILRKMKALCQIVEQHGGRYRELLATQRGRTDLSEAEAAQIIKRLDQVLEQLPAAREQAHKRIITGQIVANDQKILSLYDESVNVIVRGKSGAEVEFGNELLLAEQADGLIVDWHLYRDQPPADTGKLPACLDRLEQAGRKVGAITTDRGFHSHANEQLLADRGIQSGLCPRDPAALGESMADDIFARRQRRRAQTEGRVAIVKNGFIGNPVASRDFGYREKGVAWAILTHNLWLLARLRATARATARDAARHAARPAA